MSRFLNIAAAQLGAIQRADTRAVRRDVHLLEPLNRGIAPSQNRSSTSASLMMPSMKRKLPSSISRPIWSMAL